MATARSPAGSGSTPNAAAGPADASPPLVAVMLLSSAAMGYEVLLTRLFSIIQWHHFAYMMISVALLGYGAAGTFVALAQRVLLPRYRAVFAGGAVLFGITAVAGFALAQRVAFNPLELLWDPEQPLRLVVVYALLFVPFFCAATSVCLTFTRFAGEPHRIYSFDIVGAGAGSIGMLAALFALAPVDALRLTGALGIAAGAVALVRPRRTESLARGGAAHRGDRRCGRRPRRLDPPASVRVQGALADVAHRRHADRRRKVVPAGRDHRGRERARPAAARTGPEPCRDDGASAAARGVHRRRRPDRADALRRQAGAARLPRPAHVRPSVPSARNAAGAGARRGRGRRRAAGDLPRRPLDRRRRARLADHRSRAAPVRDIFRRALRRPRRARSCRRSARLRCLAPESLRPDPGRAARCVHRVGGGALRALGELSLHGRGIAGIPAASRARRHARDHALGRICRRGTSSSSSPLPSRRSSAAARGRGSNWR